MNEKRLRIYLNDHLALIVGEVQLISRCWWNNRGTRLGDFLQQLEGDVKSQKSVVKDIIHRSDGKDKFEGIVKQSAARLAVMLGRFKLNDALLRYSALSRIVELEALAATSQGRIALWDTLEAVARPETCLANIEFSIFRDQSQKHLDELNHHRRTSAAEAFAERA